ncbi:hypothetical protein [Flavobacterium sp.]|uniref:hypothetical protein n=1 Tax=Flavobacterium sp. TaxID=239 RepID=UPI0040479764
MKLNRNLIIITILSITFLSFGQNKALKTSEIEIIPHWKINEVHSVIIKNTTTDIVKEKPLTYLTTFNASFKVLEKTDTEYLVEWIFTNSKLAENDPNFETNILAKLLNIKFQIKLSNFGKFIELVNVDEIRIASNKAIDELNAKEMNPNMKVQYNGVKQMIVSKQGLEIALLKYVKLYNFSFGYEYKTNYEQVNNVKFPNPLGGEPFEAVEKVKLINVDLNSSICKIETSKNVDGEILSKSVMEFLKRNNKNHIKEIEQEFGNYVFEITENSMQELNFEKGILLKSSFTRKMNLGIQNRTLLIEIEAVE